ncbi:MAG: hypothetical protein AAF962_04935 [Actinomycetota bacterium]
MTDVRLDVDGAADVVDAVAATAAVLRAVGAALGPLAVRSPVLWPPVHPRLRALAVAVDGTAEHLRSVRGAAQAADGGGGVWDGVRRGWNDGVGTVVPFQVRMGLGAADTAHSVATAPWNLWRALTTDGSGATSADTGGTFSLRSVGEFPGGDPGPPAAAGRSAVARFVADTAGAPTDPGGPPRLLADEFQLIDHGDRTFTLVLGGVIDLSDPELGLASHRSPRDLDVNALETALDPSTGDDAYARQVADGVRHAGVPPGSRLLVVGHSYGAAAAVQLAADPVFNGDEYEVTHVVAAGYHVEPWLPLVAPDTEVLALNNRHDLVVGVERLADGLLIDGPGPGHDALVRSFPGGRGGAGHAQEHYVAYLEQTGDPAVAGFLRSVAVTGFARSGEATAVDISMP